MKLLYGMGLITIAQMISYLQLQGQGKWLFFKENPYLMMFLGLPIGYLLIMSTSNINEYFGSTWQGRLIGQGIGIIIFALMSFVLFKEEISIKTGICIALAFIIILINVFWK